MVEDRGVFLCDETERGRLAGAGLLDVSVLLESDAGELVKAPHEQREIRRLPLGAGAVFLKRYRNVAPLDGGGRGTSPGPALTEWRALRLLSAAGLPVARPLLVHERRAKGRFTGVLLLAALPSGEKLEAVIPSAAPGRLGALAVELGAVARRMHDAGVVHRDFYAVHVLAEPEDPAAGGRPPRLWLLDFNRARVLDDVPLRARVKDLAQLHFSTQASGAPPSFILRILRAYGRDRDRAWRKSLARLVFRKAVRIGRRVAARVAEGRPNIHFPGRPARQ